MDLQVLGQTMKRAQHRNHRAMDGALQEVGVSLVQWDALRAIERMPRASGRDLAVATFQSDQSFGALATRMVERGLITRSAGRGRRLEHALTDAGRTAPRTGAGRPRASSTCSSHAWTRSSGAICCASSDCSPTGRGEAAALCS